MFIVLLIGLTILAIGIRARMGGFRSLYIVKSVSFILPRLLKFGFIPFGLLVSTFAIYGLIFGEGFAKINYSVFYILIAFFFITCIFQPRWMLPRWLVYLYDTYGNENTDYLLDRASWNVPLWLEKVETHEGLVTWAEETMAKRKPRLKSRTPS